LSPAGTAKYSQHKTLQPLTDSPQFADKELENELILLHEAVAMDIADDSKTMRGIVQWAVRQVAFRGLTSEAENGAQRLKKLRAEQPKLILSDWHMPEMSGIEFLVQVRTSEYKVPFGFITSEASAAIKELAMSSGASFLITKPFSREDMQEARSPLWGKC
jgi:two-component system chemotaxis response regulator CheY